MNPFYKIRVKEKPQTVAGSDFLRKFEVTTNQITMTNLNNSIEVWKDVPGYEGFYQVSSFGRVKSLPRVVPNSWKTTNNQKTVHERILKHGIVRGYHHVALAKEGINKHCRVHRLVLIAFCGYDENKTDVNHKDCDKSNNHLSNLEWCNPKENVHHALANGRYNHSPLRGVHFQRPVFQYSKDGKLIKRWKSRIEVQNAGVCSVVTIQRYLNGRTKNGAYIWSDYELNNHQQITQQTE